jgi:biotin transport system substrate-specific component
VRPGFAIFAGPTGGYLLAFPFAAALTGALAERGWDRRFLTMLAAMLLGSTVIFALGLIQLRASCRWRSSSPRGFCPSSRAIS